MDMTQASAPTHPDQQQLQDLSGFFVEIDPARERVDIVLHRPPYDVVSVAARDQPRVVFEALDAGDHARVIVVRALGAHFSSDGDIGGFLEVSSEHAPRLA